MKTNELARQIRNSLSLSQAELAEQLGGSQRAVSEAESGTNQKMLDRIVEHFVEKYGYERALFYAETKRGDEELRELNERVNRIEESLTELKELIIRYIRKDTKR